MKRRLLLFALSICSICLTTSTYAQNLLSESFDDLSSFPPTGWTNSNYQQIYSSWGGTAYWDQGVGVSYPSPSPHSGAGYAYYNSGNLYWGSTAELASPQFTVGAVPGGYTLVSFWLYNYDYGSSDELDVYLNADNSSASGSPTLLGSIFPNAGPSVGWYKYQYVVPSSITGAQYLIFKSTSDFGADMLLDDVSIDVVQPCSGVPTVGTLSPDSVCSGATFTLVPSDTALVNGVAYSWQSSTDGLNWTTIPTATNSTYSTSISAPTYFRMIAQCTNSSLADTTPAKRVTLNPFYICYCSDVYTSPYTEANIGNVSITAYGSNTSMLNNGLGFPTVNNVTAVNNYTDYTNLPPTPLYVDSVYNFSVTQIDNAPWWNGGAPINIFIDLNQDGVFEPGELVFDKNMGSSSSNPTVTDTFRIPANAPIGVTGMRVILGLYQSDPLNPCTPYEYGETEDYLVYISPDLCGGPVNPGTATATDSTLCPGMGYSFTLADVNHERGQGGVTWEWEQSPDNGFTWGPVANTLNRDTITIVYNLPVWYRMRVTCSNSNSITYSNIVKMHNNQNYACYCYSEAIGGRQFDSSDIGAFGMGRYMFSSTNQINNSHVSNPSATRGHTDNSTAIMHFVTDSTYHAFVYHILKTATHGDAKVTMFIDYNNNLVYDAPEERVWTAYTTADSFFLTTDITIPHNVIPNVYTGMRVIINNNTAPNVPSDEACGAYASGETEDYVVMLHDSSTVNVAQVQSDRELLMYPNPTNGKVKIYFSSVRPAKQMSVVVSSVTGQHVLTASYNNIGTDFSTDLDLTAQPRGIYFVEFITDGQRSVQKLTLQ